MSIQKLDNPVWHSLNEVHKDIAFYSGDQKFYQPEFCPFGSSVDSTYSETLLKSYSQETADFFLVGNAPSTIYNLGISNRLICDQMVLETPIDYEINIDIQKLDDSHSQALFHLVDMVQPGYFREKTFCLGSYFGVFEGQELIAAAGERMKMDSFTEISAVVTHPKFRGRGLAKQLIKTISDNIFLEDKMPFLHVLESNQNAISIYHQLGFDFRRKIDFLGIKTAK